MIANTPELAKDAASVFNEEANFIYTEFTISKLHAITVARLLYRFDENKNRSVDLNNRIKISVFAYENGELVSIRPIKY